MNSTISLRPLRLLAWLSLLALLAIGLPVQAQQADPPGRVAAVTQRHGSVVFAPAGEQEWTELPINRPLTQADRLWTDQGARLELHLGSATMHMNGLSHLGLVELDDEHVRMHLSQGGMNIKVRQLRPGEAFRIETPNLALQVQQPAEWRVDVDPAAGLTHLVVRSGEVTVSGARGRALVMGAGQQATWTGTDLVQVQAHAQRRDDFDQWAAERNALEDRSLTARYVPRDVIGYHQLDSHGIWAQDSTYGTVWYPRVTVADWAPYRYGHWSWIEPWGWTWIDDAPWGFAPFHYGRWAQIGPRWAWVPGAIGPRPVYAPALVVFIGASSGHRPGSGWYPLGPGETWQPWWRASPRYVRNVNRDVVPAPGLQGRGAQRAPHWVTSVRPNDFDRERARERDRSPPPGLQRTPPPAGATAAPIGRPAWPQAPRAEERQRGAQDLQGPRPGLLPQPPVQQRQAPAAAAVLPTAPAVPPPVQQRQAPAAAAPAPTAPAVPPPQTPAPGLQRSQAPAAAAPATAPAAAPAPAPQRAAPLAGSDERRERGGSGGGVRGLNPEYRP